VDVERALAEDGACRLLDVIERLEKGPFALSDRTMRRPPMRRGCERKRG
jgi:hypothetical protein